MGYRFTDRQKLCASALAVMGVTLAMGLMLIEPHHADYRDSRDRLQALRAFRETLQLAQAVSAERGPANSVMGARADEAPPARERLREFRARTDAGLDRLREAIAQGPWRDRGGWLAQTERLRDRIARVRGQVDRIGAQPHGQRDPAAVAGTVEQAFRLVDDLQPLVTVAGTRLTAAAPSASGNVTLARVLSDAREYGGRLASLAMPSVITRTPLQPGTRAAMEQMRGRLGALQAVMLHSDLIDLDGGEDHDQAQLASGAVRALQDGMRIMDRLVEQGAETGRYPLTARMLTDAYVPTLRPLEEARDDLLQAIDARLRQERDDAMRVLAWTLAALAVVLGVVAATLWLALRRIFAPLLAVAQELVALAEKAPEPARRTRSEIRLLQDAVQVLRQRLEERDLLDMQRQADGERLRRAAETDVLTGLANRRALFQAGENQAGHRRAHDLAACLILFDVDRFKRINDLHGHPAGDQVLRAVAATAAAQVRAGDLLARFGGEEFAVLVFDPDEAGAVALAEKLRAALAGTPHPLPGGERLQVTASFGVASGQRGEAGWLDLLDRADQALYLAKQGGRDRVCAGADLAAGD